MREILEEANASAIEAPDPLKVSVMGSTLNALTVVRQVLDGEDVESGTAYVEESVLAPADDVDEGDAEDDPEAEEGDDDEDEDDDAPVVETPYVIPAYSADEKKRLLSKVPLEALYYIMTALTSGDLGPDMAWWDLEPEVVLEEIGKVRDIDAAGAQRILAFRAFLHTESASTSFYTDPRAFAFLVSSFSGRLVRWNESDAEPTTVEIAIAMNIATKFRPGAYSDSVLGFIAASALRDGHWALPGILEVAQPKVYEACRNLDIPVDAERVARVMALPDPGIEYDASGPYASIDLTQARAYHGLDSFIDEAIDRAETLVTRVIRGLGSHLTEELG